jgi:hypothetical protein
MAINVLQYNQLIRKVNVKNEQIEAQRRLRDSADSACGQIPDQIQSIIDSINNYDSAIDSAQNYVANFGTNLDLLGLSECNYAFYSHDLSCVCAWQHIRNVCDIAGYTSVGCFCLDTVSTNCCHGQCGRSCAFTVPAGVNRVQIELWGPGASTTWGACCAFSPNGATGSYYSNVFCVAEGDVLNMCAGCSICCYAKGCEGGYPASNLGGASSVYGCSSATGSNVCFCVCVMGGRASLYDEMLEREACCGPACQGYCQGYWGSGNCLCTQGYWMCHESSRSSRGYESHAGQGGYCQCVIHYKLSRCSTTYEGNVTSAITVPAMCFMVPSILPKGFFNQDQYGSICSQGTPKFPCIQCYCFTSETCWGGQSCQNCCGHRRSPGAGGMGNHAMSGGTAWCGDIGRAGAVYVRYGCI